MKILEADCLVKVQKLKHRLLKYISDEIIILNADDASNFSHNDVDEGEINLTNVNKHSTHSSKSFEDKKKRVAK